MLSGRNWRRRRYAALRQAAEQNRAGRPRSDGTSELPQLAHGGRTWRECPVARPATRVLTALDRSSFSSRATAMVEASSQSVSGEESVCGGVLSWRSLLATTRHYLVRHLTPTGDPNARGRPATAARNRCDSARPLRSPWTRADNPGHACAESPLPDHAEKLTRWRRRRGCRSVRAGAGVGLRHRTRHPVGGVEVAGALLAVSAAWGGEGARVDSRWRPTSLWSLCRLGCSRPPFRPGTPNNSSAFQCGGRRRDHP